MGAMTCVVAMRNMSKRREPEAKVKDISGHGGILITDTTEGVGTTKNN